MKKIKWGIIGLGSIALQFCQGLLFSEQSELYALASTNKQKEDLFKSQFEFSTFHNSYESLLKDKNVDVIYIASPNHAHFPQALQAIEAGKHVLCEKPACLTPEDLQALQEKAKQNNVFFMEALWTAFLPNIRYILDTIKSNKLGKIQHISSSFGFKAEYIEDSRLFSKKLGGGSVYDIGIYPILLSHLCLGTPNKINAQNTFAPTGCDSASFFELFYNNVITKNQCSFNKNLPNTATITFEKGEINIPAMFHMPQDIIFSQMDSNQEIKFDFIGNGYNYEADHVAECILNNIIESPIISHKLSLSIAEIIQQIIAQK